ncbi:MAG: hypothetical protein HUJ54_06355 [Erysipelotrichaceae bacterium]|nr:hypothetical protein [Erysipelotrichaceae bacterium]
MKKTVLLALASLTAAALIINMNPNHHRTQYSAAIINTDEIANSGNDMEAGWIENVVKWFVKFLPD